MQVCFNLLVWHRKFWYCIPKEVHLCCSLLLNSKNFRILTETGDIISPSIWAIFDKNSSLSLFKKKWWKSSKVLKLASFSTLMTLFRLKRTIPTSSSKKNYVSPSQKSTLWLKKMVSVKKQLFLLQALLFSFKNEAIWKIRMERIFDFLSSS